jgi:hypothetical protein
LDAARMEVLVWQLVERSSMFAPLAPFHPNVAVRDSYVGLAEPSGGR